MKPRNRNQKLRTTRKLTPRKKLLIVGFALYLTFILLSTIPYIAESQLRTRQNEMDEKYDYYLVFKTDGEQSHYYVERVNTSKNGEITLTYTTASHTLEVDTVNIKILTIDCKKIYFDESMKVFKKNPNDDVNYYKTYFIDRDLFNVNVYTEYKIEKLRFKYAPEPIEVFVDGNEWWKTQTNYEFEDPDIVLTEVPKGSTNVKLYFAARPPEAIFTIGETNTYIENNKLYGYVNSEISFDASDSNDDDDGGKITKYEWDFGDDTPKETGKTPKHTYAATGEYDVKLTVTDDDNLKAEHTESIIIVEIDNDKDNDGMDDDWELEHQLDPTNPNDKDLDNDGDDLTNIQEFQKNTDPTNEDTDNDNMPDGWEDKYALDPLANDANLDEDSDSFSNLDEYLAGTNPRNRNSVPTKKEEKDEDKGLFGLGKVGGIDLFIILMLIIIIIIIILIAGMLRKKKEEEEEVEEEVAAPEEIEEEAAEEEEAYECPECGAPIEEDQDECEQCGAALEWGEEEIEEEGEGAEEEAEKVEEEVEPMPVETEEEVEGEEEEGEEDEYECPTCGAPVPSDAMSCPECGEEFE